MNHRSQIRDIFLALTFVMNGAVLLQADDAKPEPVTVPKILKVSHQIAIAESFPPNLYVKAIGEVPTGGYTNVKLERAIYVTPPKDGIQDYFLKAVPPSGPAIAVISQVESIDLWHDVAANVRIAASKSTTAGVFTHSSPVNVWKCFQLRSGLRNPLFRRMTHSRQRTSTPSQPPQNEP